MSRATQCYQSHVAAKAARAPGKLSQVRQHYDGLGSMSKHERQESAIAGLRSFHNFIKAALISLYVPTPLQAGTANIAALDLCCGRGGDIQKWMHAGVQSLVMMDISGNSIQQAQARYDSLRSPHKPHVSFHVANCFSPDAVQPLLEGHAFDVVSCQFSAHYAFGDEETAKNLFRNAASHLKEGGHVLMTVPDGTVLAQRFFSRGLSNDLHSVALKRTDAARALMSEPAFGLPYTFTLLEAVEGVPEYIVTRTNIEHAASQCGLALARWDTFDKFGADPAFESLRQVMLKQSMSADEQFVSDLYRVAVFVKLAPK